MRNKVRCFILLPAFLFTMMSCGSGNNNTSEPDKVFLGTISNKATFENYLNHSSSYIESGNESSGYYVVITVIITSLDESYYFENLQLSISGDKDLKKYKIPTDGNLTITCNSQTYTSRESRSYYLMTSLSGNINNPSGTVYKKRN